MYGAWVAQYRIFRIHFREFLLTDGKDIRADRRIPSF